MYQTNSEIFEAVKQLKGKTVYTITRNKPNKIVDIVENDYMDGEIFIEGRNTVPLISQVVEAYKLLFTNGELERNKDLASLAHVSKQVSSVVFAIVYEIAKEEVELIQRGRTIVIAVLNSF